MVMAGIRHRRDCGGTADLDAASKVRSECATLPAPEAAGIANTARSQMPIANNEAGHEHES